MNAIQSLELRRTPERQAHDWREFMEAAEPIVKQLVRLHRLAPPVYLLTPGADGQIANIQRLNDGLPDELEAVAQFWRDEYERLAKSYGFEVRPQETLQFRKTG